MGAHGVLLGGVHANNLQQPCHLTHTEYFQTHASCRSNLDGMLLLFEASQVRILQIREPGLTEACRAAGTPPRAQLSGTS